MTVQAPRISLVIPCRNEEERLPATMEAVLRYLRQAAGNIGEVLVVVEKGEDDTVAIAGQYAEKDSRIRVIANPIARGKGYAVKTGMLQATGDIIFFMDADLSVPLRFVDEFTPHFSQSYDVAIGCRRHPRSVIPRRQSLLRVLYGRLFNRTLRLLRITSLRDTQCGFKAFSRTAAQKVFSKVDIDGFGFDVEALALAECQGFRVIECPVEWSNADGSKVRTLHGLSALYEAVLAGRRVRRENA